MQGSLGGQWIKRSLSTREWSIAATTLHEWEAARAIGGKRFEIEGERERWALHRKWGDSGGRLR